MGAFPTKIDYRKEGYPYSNLSTGGPVHGAHEMGDLSEDSQSFSLMPDHSQETGAGGGGGGAGGTTVSLFVPGKFRIDRGSCDVPLSKEARARSGGRRSDGIDPSSP